MRHEPIEFGLTGTSSRTRGMRRMTRSARVTAPDTTAKCAVPEILDEAFAGFASSSPHRLEHGLVAGLSAQLEALDRQREQLSRLLRTIDADSISQ